MRAFGLRRSAFQALLLGAAPDRTIIPLPGLGMNPSFQFRFSLEGGSSSGTLEKCSRWNI